MITYIDDEGKHLIKMMLKEIHQITDTTKYFVLLYKLI